MLKEISGDLLDLFDNGNFDVIGHGSNCYKKMMSGIAKQIRERWPASYEADLGTIAGDFSKLGNYTFAKVPRNCGKDGYIYNLYTQHKYGNDGELYLQYCALQLSLEKLFYYNKSAKIGLPRIGCGLAGGDWFVIRNIIEDLVDQYNADVTIVTYNKD